MERIVSKEAEAEDMRSKDAGSVMRTLEDRLRVCKNRRSSSCSCLAENFLAIFAKKSFAINFPIYFCVKIN